VLAVEGGWAGHSIWSLLPDLVTKHEQAYPSWQWQWKESVPVARLGGAGTLPVAVAAVAVAETRAAPRSLLHIGPVDSRTEVAGHIADTRGTVVGSPPVDSRAVGHSGLGHLGQRTRPVVGRRVLVRKCSCAMSAGRGCWSAGRCQLPVPSHRLGPAAVPVLKTYCKDLVLAGFPRFSLELPPFLESG